MAVYFVLLGFAAFLTQATQLAAFRVAGAKLTTRIRGMVFDSFLRSEIARIDTAEGGVGGLVKVLVDDARNVQGMSGQTMGQVVLLVSNVGVGVGVAMGAGWQLALGEL